MAKDGAGCKRPFPLLDALPGRQVPLPRLQGRACRPSRACHPRPRRGRGPRDRRETEMDETTETSKLTMDEEEAMATARRLCGGYLEHRSIEVVNDGAQAGASTQTPCATTSWPRPSRVTGRPPYATSWEFAAGQRIRAEGHTAHNAKGTAGREPPAVPISHRHGRNRTLLRSPSPPSGTPNDGGEGNLGSG